MKRCLITGGCGFIGSNLTKELVKQGWQVDIVDDMSNGYTENLDSLDTKYFQTAQSFYFEKSDGRKQNQVYVVISDFVDPYIRLSVQNKDYDVVFHQAAIPRVEYSVQRPVLTTEENIGKTIDLFDCVAKNKIIKRIVWASSSSVYGGADILPTPETCAKNPKSPYAWQKSAIEDYAKMAKDLYGLEIVCLRYFNVFGPGQYGSSPYSTAVSAWCHAIKNDLECRSDGDGEQSRDMNYVDNVVQANILAANSEKDLSGECFNIACGERVTNNEILDALKHRLGSKVKVRNAPERQGDVKHTQANITKAKEVLGYEPTVYFWEGLDKTLKWWDI